MVFGSIIAGLEPDIERTIGVIRNILETALAEGIRGITPVG